VGKSYGESSGDFIFDVLRSRSVSASVAPEERLTDIALRVWFPPASGAATLDQRRATVGKPTHETAIAAACEGGGEEGGEFNFQMFASPTKLKGAGSASVTLESTTTASGTISAIS
jgi:hypothetical protein